MYCSEIDVIYTKWKQCIQTFTRSGQHRGSNADLKYSLTRYNKFLSRDHSFSGKDLI